MTSTRRSIAVEQSKFGLDDTKAQILINVDNQFRSLQEARIAVGVATAKQECLDARSCAR